MTLSRPSRRVFLLLSLLLVACFWWRLAAKPEQASSQAASYSASEQPFMVETVLDGLSAPWGMAFLPNHDVLITEKSGRLLRLSGKQTTEITGLPESKVQGQGGLLDVAIDPEFASNSWVYLSYTYPDGLFSAGTAVGRGQLNDHVLKNWQTLYAMQTTSRSGNHFGSRLSFDRQGYLYITTGDRGDRHRSQDPTDSAGSVLRIHADGRIPADNPFVGQAGFDPAIFSYGHRNPQGAALNRETGELWIHEHGPQGGDELNRIAAGKNYGWPIVTYGKEYGTGFNIGEGTRRPDMEPPVHYWVPSIAPSGMAFYTGNALPDWQGDIIVGSLKFQLLVRLVMDDEKVVREERYLQGQYGRIRDIEDGPDGHLYVLTNASNGQLLRLVPKP